MITRSPILALIVVCSFATSGLAQSKQPQNPTPNGPRGQRQRPGGTGPGAQRGPDAPPTGPKKYEDVITKDAKTQTGMFKVHRIEDKVFWEIPTKLLDRDLLWQTEVSQLPHSLGYPGTGMGIHAVKFSRRGNKIFLKDCNYDTRARGDSGTKAGVAENTIDPILMAFNVETEGPDKAPVIDVTSLFTTDASEFSVGPRMGLAGADPSRSYIDRVKAFPENIETRSLLTFNGGGGGGGLRRGGGGGGGVATTAVVHYSLDLLPETPMRGRLKDTRIGFFTTAFYEYGRAENRATERQFINRFRLEKKDPKADVSEPVKPIVYYLPKEVPLKWRPYIKAGIEDWQPVFEQAGFKNAIQCKDAPDEPNWDPEDARYSVVRWAPSQTENAMGASIQDPRSGETISAHIIVWNDIVRLLEDWDFAQTAASDPTSRSLPFSDEKIGKMLRYVITHEVGHTLGLEHNFKASVAYTVKELRDPEFMKTHGTSASVMSYSRFDYVAQPGDGVAEYSNRLGPYDYFAIEYGYKPLPHTLSPDDEKTDLDALLSKQVGDRTVRFGNYLYPGIDPGMQNENISDDPVEAGKLGLQNIDTIATVYLLPYTSKFGEDYSRLQEMEQNLLGQRTTELLHVAPLVGGVVQTDYHAGRGGEVFAPVPAAKQAEAVHFLTTEGFRTPSALLRPEIMNRLQPTGVVQRVTGLQSLILLSLLSTPRVARMEDNEAQNGRNAYTVAKLVADVSTAVWSEVDSPMPMVDVYRRTLQRNYLAAMDTKINADTHASDLRSLERDDLQNLAKKIDHALPRTKDRVTYLHLKDCRTDIERILLDKYSTSSGGAAPDLSFLFGATSSDDTAIDPDACWTPYSTIRQAVEELQKEYRKKD